MKKLASVLLMLGFSSFAHAATRSATLQVKGWTCGACASASKIALKKVNGVESVSTDTTKAEAVVTYDDSRVTPQQLVEAVEKLGYKATVKGGSQTK
ncbi:MAG: cation transporter [Thermoanaerobaculia bacterium]